MPNLPAGAPSRSRPVLSETPVEFLLRLIIAVIAAIAVKACSAAVDNL